MSDFESDRIIDPDTLIAGHTLSFTDQPYLARLLRELTETDRRITLVVGAGVSMDAGLPSWSRLIENMARTIHDEGIQRLALSDDADLMRKAEVVLELIESEPRNKRSTIEIVRDALFQASTTAPGELADAIGRLVAAAPGRFRVITTNFDQILETAITEYLPSATVRSFGLREVDEWQTFCEQGGCGILHVHGLVATGNNKSKEPIVLTESQFLSEGPKVRELIRRETTDASVVFIGVSMTDPNLVGPLWDLYNATTSTPSRSSPKVIGDEPARYVLLVPGGRITEDSSALEYRYFVEKARYLDRKLSVSPIFVKSYSQLVQAISDMAMALVQPTRYRRRASAGQRSIRYGVRFREVLDSAYASIGCTRRSDVPSGPQADNLSNLLFSAVHDPTGALSKTLAAIGADCRRAISKRVGVAEKFGLALWLRSREHGSTRSKYAVRLVGESHLTYAAPWVMPEPELILPGTSNTIAETLYKNMTLARRLPVGSGASPWRGMVATPITVYGAGSEVTLPDSSVPLDRLTVGVAVLYTTHNVVDEVSPTPAGLPTSVRPESLDAISVLSYAQSVGRYADLARVLRESATQLLFPT